MARRNFGGAGRRKRRSLTAAGSWAEALEQWRVPDEILAQAPESPWGFPPALFPAPQTGDSSLHRRARAALGNGGTVLDIGCGGGGASVPLVPPATALIGVDISPAMLGSFSGAAERTGASHTEVLGEWPDAADTVPAADVVVWMWSAR